MGFLKTLAVVGFLLALSTTAQAKDTSVCVEVKLVKGKSEASAPVTKIRIANTYRLTPQAYLTRMLEHYITHEQNFVAVKSGCRHRMVVELYPLRMGWTAFARYSGNQQEEKIDQVFYSELPRVAKRFALALLHNKSVDQTIDRLSVLKADSVTNIETIKGTDHFVAAVGSGFRFPVTGLPSARKGAPGAEVKSSFRLLTPVNLQLGYRGSFTSWCIDTYARLGIGVSKKSQKSNELGGHVNHDIDFGLGLSMLWYAQPKGINSFYGGAGASFDMSWYSVVEPADYSGSNKSLFGGGLTLNGIIGYEFLRTSSVRPFTQLEFHVPAFLVSTENEVGSIDSWIPGVTVMAGAMF